MSHCDHTCLYVLVCVCSCASTYHRIRIDVRRQFAGVSEPARGLGEYRCLLPGLEPDLHGGRGEQRVVPWPPHCAVA